MGDKNIRVIWNGGIELLLMTAHAVLHEHRHSPELQALYLHTAAAEVMDIVVKSVQMSTVKTGVVIAGDQHLVPVWEVTEPLKEVKCFCLGARHREVPAVHEDIRLREVPQAAVDTVGVGNMQDSQVHGAKLINPRDPDEYFRKCHHRTRLVSRDKGNSFHCHGTLPEG